MTILFIEPGTSATNGLEFFSSSAGTVTSAADQTHGGNPRSLKIANGNSNVIKTSLLADSGRRASFYFCRGSLATQAALMYFSSVGGGVRLALDTSGNLLFQDGSITRGTGTHPISAATWTHIAWAFTRTSSSVNRFKAWVNGVLDIDLTDVTWTQATGDFRPQNESSLDDWWNHIYIDDVSDLTFPGDIRVTAKLPVALNTNNFDTLVGSGTNRYDRVSERPLSVTNGIQHAAATDVQENFGIQAASAGDVDISDAYIVGYCGWVYAKRGEFDTKQITGIGIVQSKT